MKYLFLHIPKTGGTPLTVDIQNGQFSPLFLPCAVPLHQLKLTVSANLAATCTISSCECKIQNVPANVVLMMNVRNPTFHVVSLWEHCQQESAVKKKPRISLTEVVELVSNGTNTGKYCGYPFRDFQTDRLGGGNLTLALEVVDAAFHVGITEHYAASMCLLRAKTKTGNCTCETIANLNVSHFDHGFHTPLSANLIRKISRITLKDQVLHARAVTRLFKELQKLKLECTWTA